MSKNLRALIIGNDIGQLVAANGLQQHGFHVELFETLESAQVPPQIIILTPDSTTSLARYGICLEQLGVPIHELTVHTEAGKVIHHLDQKHFRATYHHDWLLTTNATLRSVLQESLVSGKSCTVHSLGAIASIREEPPLITLKEGQTVMGDILLTSNKMNTEGPSGSYTVMTYLDEQILSVLSARQNKEFGVHFEIWSAEGREAARLSWNGATISWTCAYLVDQSAGQQLAGIFNDFEVRVQEAISNVSLDSPTLRHNSAVIESQDLRPGVQNLVSISTGVDFEFHLVSYTIGRAVGDAMALLAILDKDASLAELRERIALFGSFQQSSIHDSSPKTFETLLSRFVKDEYETAKQALREWQWLKSPAKLWRQPVEFGPMPGPRQSVNGEPHLVQHSTFTAATIKFSTDRTAITNLLPFQSRDRFLLAGSGSVAYASFTQTTFRDLNWLGGRGYRLLGLYVHDLEFKRPGNEQVLKGTYVPVLFETLADPIISGREELGMPKLYSSLKVSDSNEGCYEAVASWEGTTWGTFRWSSLEDLNNFTPPVPNDGIFCFRYQPRIGKLEKGTAEAAYPVLIPAMDPSCRPKIVRVRKATTATFQLDSGNWKTLPTLHHIVSRLESLPVYKVIEGHIIDGEGVPDAATTFRIDQ